MTSNIDQFLGGLDRFERQIDKQADLIVRKVAFEGLTGVVMGSPVDKGRFRGNWQVSVNVAIDVEIDRIDPSGGTTISAGSNVIATADPSQIIWLSNALPYANRIEHGHSQQAPAGVVSVTVERLKFTFGA